MTGVVIVYSALVLFVVSCESLATSSYFTNYSRVRRQANCGFTCANGDCIDETKRCNGIADCSDGSDETEACKSIWCPKYLFRCNYGACISQVKECDGNKDCIDNSDETGPNCKKNSADQTCGSGKFKCGSGECINQILECNGKPDCRDNSDETNHCRDKFCPGFLYRCAYGACVHARARCNGIKECSDGSDEDPAKCGSVTPRPPPVTTEPPPVVTTKKPKPAPVNPDPSTGECILPDHHENGVWATLIPGEQPEPRTLVGQGTVIQNRCNKGYDSINENLFSICNGGKWSESFACSKKCPPFKLLNVRRSNCTYNDKPRDCSRAIDGTFLDFKCDVFHENLGSSNFRLCKDGTWDNPSPTCTPECGKKKVDAETLSVGSEIVTKGNYPWQVAVFKKQGPHCGGSILTTNIVLTAAHCVVTENVDGTVSIDPNLYEVAVGQYYRPYKDERDAKTSQYAKVTKIIPAEQYRGRFSGYAGDIALLITDKKFKLSLTVQPVCRDTSSLYHLQGGQFGVVTGWGLLQENSDPPDEMRELKVPYTGDSECRQKLPFEYVQQFYSYDKLCAGYFNQSKAVCKGDSGGPLVFAHNGRYYVHGVVSLSPQHGGGCDSNQYTLFTNIQKYIELIEKTILKYST